MALKPDTHISVKYGDRHIVKGVRLDELRWIDIQQYQEYSISYYGLSGNDLEFVITLPGYRRG